MAQLDIKMKSRSSSTTNNEASHPFWLQSLQIQKDGAKRLHCEFYEVRDKMHAQLFDSTIRDSNLPEEKRKVCENIIRIKSWFLIYDRMPIIDRVTGERNRKLEGFGYDNHLPFDLYRIRPGAQKAYLGGYFKKLRASALKENSARIYPADLEYSPELATLQEREDFGYAA